MSTDPRTHEEIVSGRGYDIPAMIAEVERRLNDPARPPMKLRRHPLSAKEIANTKRIFQRLEEDHQDRLLHILEEVVVMPEPEQTRAFEFMYIALDVVQEMAA